MMRFVGKLLLIVAVVAGAYFYFTRDRVATNETVDVAEVGFEDVRETATGTDVDVAEPREEDVEPDEVEVEDEDIADGEEEEKPYPSQFNLAVPFTPQAPHANWSLPYGEACEEASAYMVAEYFKGTPSGKIDANVADAAILDVIAFEQDFFGYHLDTTAAETAQFIDFYFGLNATVVENPTVDQIKTEIAAGRPVIVPAAGRELGNTNFTGLGPLYHMFVVKGYTETKFITNDPGTRNGENYVYDIGVVMDAIGDWNNGDPANGAKRVIFVRP